MIRQHDPNASMREGADPGREVLDMSRIDTRERLVQEHDRGLEGEAPRHLKPTALSSRELSRQCLRLRREPKLREQRICNFTRSDTTNCNHQILASCEPRQDARMLGQETKS